MEMGETKWNGLDTAETETSISVNWFKSFWKALTVAPAGGRHASLQHMNNFSPRAGLSYALDHSHRTIAHAAYSRFAGQLSPTTIGWLNPASTAGSATYRWVDKYGDHFAQNDVVRRGAHRVLPPQLARVT